MNSYPSAFFGACAIGDKLREAAEPYVKVRETLCEFVTCYEEAVCSLADSCPEVRWQCVELIVCLGVWVEALRPPAGCTCIDAIMCCGFLMCMNMHAKCAMRGIQFILPGAEDLELEHLIALLRNPPVAAVFTAMEWGIYERTIRYTPLSRMSHRPGLCAFLVQFAASTLRFRPVLRCPGSSMRFVRFVRAVSAHGEKWREIGKMA